MRSDQLPSNGPPSAQATSRVEVIAAAAFGSSPCTWRRKGTPQSPAKVSTAPEKPIGTAVRIHTLR
jgi:hypothetical protein